MAPMRDRLIALIEPLLTQLGYELVELEYTASRNGVLRIFIDKPQGGSGGANPPGTGAESATSGSGADGTGSVPVSADEDEPRAQGIGISDCEKVSREVSALLDVEDPIPTAYQLEVSSPGDDRVLRLPAHYARFTGSRVLVELNAPRAGRRRYTGVLKQIDATGVVLEVDGQPVTAAFDEIAKARLAPL